MAKTSKNLDQEYLTPEQYQNMQADVANMRSQGQDWSSIHRYVEDNYRNPNGYWANQNGTEFYTLADQERTMLSEGAQQQAINAMSKSQSVNGNNKGAHATVEAIRAQDAAYSGGTDGSAYNILPGQYSMPNVANMSSRYSMGDHSSITDTVMNNYKEVPSIYSLYNYQDTPDYYADVDLNIPRVADANYKEVVPDWSKVQDVHFDSSNIGKTTYDPGGINTNVQFNPSGINTDISKVSDNFQYEKSPEIIDNYRDIIDSAANAIANREAFSYNPDNDPLFSVYQKQYTREGDRAAANALANAAMLSGGQASTAAIAASQQANNYYNAQLADKIPELEARAYQRYQDEGTNMRNNLDMYRSLRSDDIGLQESNRSGHQFDQQMLYDIALQDLAQENTNNQMRFNIADTQRQQENINNNMIKAIADTNLSNDQWNEQMNYNIALQNLGADQYNNTMQFNIADINRQQGNIDNQLTFDIANADASNALSRAALQVNIANGRSSNFQNDRSTQIGMAENEQGRISDANQWWYQLASADEAQRQYNENMLYNIAAADIAQENTNREAKYNTWLNNFNNQATAAELMAMGAGDYSRYGTLYGLTDDEIAQLNAAALAASLTSGSGGGSSGGSRSSGRRSSGSSSSSSGTTSNNQVILGNPASGRVTTATLKDGYRTDYWTDKGKSTTYASIMNQKDAGLLSQANSTYKNAVKNGKLSASEKKELDSALNKAYKEAGRTRKK